MLLEFWISFTDLYRAKAIWLTLNWFWGSISIGAVLKQVNMYNAFPVLKKLASFNIFIKQKNRLQISLHFYHILRCLSNFVFSDLLRQQKKPFAEADKKSDKIKAQHH